MKSILFFVLYEIISVSCCLLSGFSRIEENIWSRLQATGPGSVSELYGAIINFNVISVITVTARGGGQKFK